jgi:hypothetical protein
VVPCSQQPVRGLCPEPNEFSPYLTPCFFKIHFNIVLPYSTFLRSFFRPEFCTHFSSPQPCYMTDPSNPNDVQQDTWLRHVFVRQNSLSGFVSCASTRLARPRCYLCIDFSYSVTISVCAPSGYAKCFAGHRFPLKNPL